MKNATINITQRMLDKSIIDANKSVQEFSKNYLPVNYDDIGNGEKIEIEAIFSDGSDSELRLYRRPRGDRLLSIKNLKKRANAGDTIKLTAPDPRLGNNYLVMIEVIS